MFGMGLPELGIIAVVAVLIFGPKKIPELGGALGKTLRSFKEGVGQTDGESVGEDKDIDEEGKPKT